MLNTIVNVRHFGAVGDGTYDDTAALQDAIDAVEADPKIGGLFFPPGRWRVTSPLVATLWQGGVIFGGAPANREPESYTTQPMRGAALEADPDSMAGKPILDLDACSGTHIRGL